MRKYFVVMLLLCSGHCFAQIVPAKPVTFKNPPTLPAPKGYSQYAEVDMGSSTMIIMAGQVALNKNGALVGKDDMGKQAGQVFKNIKAIIEDAGGSMNDVVKLSYYIKDVSKIQAVRDVRDMYINTQLPPASTLVEVSKLFRDDILIEIEATAVIPKKK
jgi:2-iminobutanoate/2-iminopropanoate deaminase